LLIYNELYANVKMTANENKSKFVRSVVIEADFISLFLWWPKVIVVKLVSCTSTFSLGLW